ncbi:CCA tRNA nucleotidyltransferase [Alkalibacterium olivapovliticus]|uniref:CCA-adding enzyme n=1 Tax=Alkalibacterium olivapovliticus TaxID=99907 RepID=A0A2T0W951_9LACT|nr:CCA tRNA nucleotidyltransferase [Alkalibacterium olivapovliticus]PRY83242.1 tRNA nucleotidyltransferase (CCA-adding enzyme) [Alkalibacterium olivapovliticus]
MSMKVPIKGEFKKALPVLETLQKAGFEAYFVGGSVRDALLGKAVNDVDIATSAFPEEIKRLFKKTVDVGIEHGTVMVLMDDESYEVTTFRTESTYQDYRRPDSVTFVRSLKEDLKRRDLTINAFAMDNDGVIQDFFNGERDLKEQIIRAVGKPEERFHEDALRMMRAVRFASQLGFQLEADTFYAIVVNAHLLQNIAVERIQVEFVKMAMGQNVLQGMEAFFTTNLYQYCPGMSHGKVALRRFSLFPRPVKKERHVWALLLYFLGIQQVKEGAAFLKHWKLSNQLITESTRILELILYRHHSPLNHYKVYTFTPPIVWETEDLLELLKLPCDKRAAANLIHTLPIQSRDELDINGRIIMEKTNNRGGRWLGEAISMAEKAVVLGAIPNEQQAILEWLKESKYI